MRVAYARIVLGLVFVTSGFLKLVSKHSEEFQRTFSWDAVGGNPTLLTAVVAIEVAAGIALLMQIFVRTVAWSAALAVLAAGVAYMIWKTTNDAPCGCFGTASRGITSTTTWYIVRSLFIFVGLAVVALFTSAKRKFRAV